jgi:Nup85 Nucleoporin
MIGTLIAPLAVLFNFYALERKGNGAAAVQHLSKLIHLSSMPREYIPLLTAEMLPILDRKPPPLQLALIGRKPANRTAGSV